MDDCFHGVLDRRTAEDRLSSSAKPGSYLIRESDKKSGSFVLSYYGKTGINHFKITRVIGCYYVGGRKFDSLVELIDHYHKFDLLTEERLAHPVAPPEPVPTQCRVFISILPYTGLNQDELNFKKGNLFIYEHDHGNGWYWCRDVKTGDIGLVFCDLIEEVIDDIDPNEIFPWFHANLSKSNAVEKLAQKGPGSFLVKASESSPGNYTLFYHAGNTVQRFQIVKSKDCRYVMGGRCFDSLGQIIELYRKEQIIEGHFLQIPVTTTIPRSDQLQENSLSSSMRALEVREKPEDIYHTVKQSRELARSQEVRGWLSLKKGDISKKWKRYYFILNPVTCHLYYYEKALQAKPKGLIDLSYSFIYSIDNSLFECSQCFQLIEKSLPCFASYFYLRCEDDYQQYIRWIKTIRPFSPSYQPINNANHQRQVSNQHEYSNELDSTNGDSNFVEKKSLKIIMFEAQSLKVSQPQFFVSFNQDIKLAKTQIKTSPMAVFDKDEGTFEFKNLPLEVKTVNFSLYQSNKRSKPTMIAESNFKLENLEANRPMDIWFELSSSKGEKFGRVKTRLLFSRDIIMNRSQYAALEDLVIDPSSDLLSILGTFPDTGLAQPLANILTHNKVIATVLRPLIESEVSIQIESDIMLNIETLTMNILEVFLRQSCDNVLNHCLRQSIVRIMDIGAEMNLQEACTNMQNLFVALDEFIQNIYNSVQYFSMPARYLLAVFQKAICAKWPSETLIRTRSVAGFIFLRFICPAIIKPKEYGFLSNGHSANPDQKRIALVTAKCLQNLANIGDVDASSRALPQQIIYATQDDLIENKSTSFKTILRHEDYAQSDSIIKFVLSPQLEDWIEVLQPLILKKKLGLVKFIDELCNLDINCEPTVIDNLTRDTNNNGNNMNSKMSTDQLLLNDTMQSGGVDIVVDIDEEGDEKIAKDLALVHKICESHRAEFERLTNSSSTVKKLLTTLKIMSQRKSYYSKLPTV